MFIAELIRINALPEFNLKVIAGRAGIHRRTMDNILYRKRAHASTLRRILDKIPQINLRDNQL